MIQDGERHNIQPKSVKLIEFGIIEIEDDNGVLYRYAVEKTGVLQLGQLIRYPVKIDGEFWTLAMFCPIAPYGIPWVLEIKK